MALKDDVAVAVALGAFEFAKRPPHREPWVEVLPYRFAKFARVPGLSRTRMDSNQLLRLRLKISESEPKREKVTGYDSEHRAEIDGHVMEQS